MKKSFYNDYFTLSDRYLMGDIHDIDIDPIDEFDIYVLELNKKVATVNLELIISAGIHYEYIPDEAVACNGEIPFMDYEQHTEDIIDNFSITIKLNVQDLNSIHMQGIANVSPENYTIEGWDRDYW